MCPPREHFVRLKRKVRTKGSSPQNVERIQHLHTLELEMMVPLRESVKAAETEADVEPAVIPHFLEKNREITKLSMRLVCRENPHIPNDHLLDEFC